MKQILVIAFIVASLNSLHASDDAFRAGNEAYREGNYAEAIVQYESLLDDDPGTPVYYNLGNAYYKTGNFTQAIIQYERALKLSPNDKDIRHNLELANLSVADKINATPEFFLLTWWKSLSLQLRADRWTVLFLAFLWAAIAAFIAFAFLNTRLRKALFLSGLSGSIIAVLFLLLALTRNHYDTSGNAAIVTEPSASVKSAPLNSSTDLFIIHEGLKVEVIGSEGDWLKIMLADGKEGWLPARMAEGI